MENTRLSSILILTALLLVPCSLVDTAAAADRHMRMLKQAVPQRSDAQLRSAATGIRRQAERYGIDTDFAISVLATEADLQEWDDKHSYLRREFHVQTAKNSDQMMSTPPVLNRRAIPIAVNALYYALIQAKKQDFKLNRALRIYWEGVSGEERISSPRFIRETEQRYAQLSDFQSDESSSGEYRRKTDFTMPVMPGGEMDDAELEYDSRFAENLSRQGRDREYASFARKYNPDLSRSQSLRIARAVIQYSNQVKIDPRLVMALLTQESGFQPEVVSSAGAMGIAQLMPATARTFGVSDPYDPVQGIWAATRYLRRELNRFNGSKRLSLAAYNAGAGAVQKYDGIPPYPETQNYVRSVMSLYRRLRG